MSIFESVSIKKLLSTELPENERREVLEELFVFGKENQRPFLNRMAVLLIVSTIIACCGLLSDSAAVVIGAMLVAPMMRPVMTTAAAITLGWSKEFYQSIILTACMAIGAVLIALLFAWVSPDLLEMPEQVLARTKPTFFDLVIALAAGAGGSYTMTRKESSAIPGVAMAVALLPPLASCGILLVFHEEALALKAFILFATNFAAMVLAGALMFMAVGVSPKKQREKHGKRIRNYIIAFGFLVMAISVPLYFYSNEVWYDATYLANQSEELQSWLEENQLYIDDVKIDYERNILYLKLIGPEPPLNVELLHNELEKLRAKKHVEHTPFSIEVLWTKTANFSWPPHLSLKKDERQLKEDHSQTILETKWQWVGTQYADGDWLRPLNVEKYFIQKTGKNEFDVSTNCAEGTGNIELVQEEVSVKLDMIVDTDCETVKTDNRFIADLNHAINISLEDDHLSLRLHNDNGVIHFEKMKSEK
ncbi:MAG: TIGR00341 family protein [Desulfuromonadales bacterium]